ncbi:MAG: hypothetical protein H6926_04085 [Chromatiales bacterium]|nr:hypothetical protein [Chromatiales bacterium]
MAANAVDVANNPCQPLLIGAIDDTRIDCDAHGASVPTPPLVALLVMGLPALFASRLRNWR